VSVDFKTSTKALIIVAHNTLKNKLMDNLDEGQQQTLFAIL